MGERTVYSILKPLDRRLSTDAIAHAISHCPNEKPIDRPGSQWRHELDTQRIVCVHSDDVLVMSSRAWRFAEFIAKTHNLLLMELRMQEGDHWDFTLYRGGQHQLLADFSTRVLYFDDSPRAPRPWKSGDLQTFAQAWEIDPQLVAPYLIDWDRPRNVYERLRRRKEKRSMPDDKFPIGDVHQIFDFMRVIGVAVPHCHPDYFELTIPVWECMYRPNS